MICRGGKAASSHCWSLAGLQESSHNGDVVNVNIRGAGALRLPPIWGTLWCRVVFSYTHGWKYMTREKWEKQLAKNFIRFTWIAEKNRISHFKMVFWLCYTVELTIKKVQIIETSGKITYQIKKKLIYFKRLKNISFKILYTTFRFYIKSIPRATINYI